MVQICAQNCTQNTFGGALGELMRSPETRASDKCVQRRSVLGGEQRPSWNSTELSMGWVDSWVGLGPNFSLAVRWVGSGHTKLGPWTTLEQYSCMSPVKTIAGVSIASAAFARLMVVTSAQTHRQTAPRLQQKTLPFLQILPTAAFLFCLGTDSTDSPRTVYRYF